MPSILRMRSARTQTDDEALCQKIIAEGRALAASNVTLAMSLPELWQIMVHIQLGLKHPGARNSSSAEHIRAMVDVWTVVLEANGAPAMAEALRRGWDR